MAARSAHQTQVIGRQVARDRSCPCKKQLIFIFIRPLLRKHTCHRLRAVQCAKETWMIWKVGMPDPGHTMDEGKVAEWLVSEGDPVARGDILATEETDKAIFDIESPGDGVLIAIRLRRAAWRRWGIPSPQSAHRVGHPPPGLLRPLRRVRSPSRRCRSQPSRPSHPQEPAPHLRHGRWPQVWPQNRAWIWRV